MYCVLQCIEYWTLQSEVQAMHIFQNTTLLQQHRVSYIKKCYQKITFAPFVVSVTSPVSVSPPKCDQSDPTSGDILNVDPVSNSCTFHITLGCFLKIKTSKTFIPRGVCSLKRGQRSYPAWGKATRKTFESSGTWRPIKFVIANSLAFCNTCIVQHVLYFVWLHAIIPCTHTFNIPCSNYASEYASNQPVQFK